MRNTSNIHLSRMYFRGVLYMNLRIVSSSLKALAVAVCIALVLMLIFTFISMTKQDPEKYLEGFVYFCLYIPALFCGYCAAKEHKMKYIPTALLSGAMFALFIFIISLFYGGGTEPTGLRWLLYLLIPFCSLVGGVLASPKQKTLRRRKKTPHKA